MKKTIISTILATTLAGMVFAVATPMTSAAQLDGPKDGSTVVHIQAGGISLDSVPSFNYGAITDTQAGFTSGIATSAAPIQVTDLRGASLPWYVTASAGDLTLQGKDDVKLLTSAVSMNIADGTAVAGQTVDNIYSADDSATATVANGGLTTTATTMSGTVTSTIKVNPSSTLQAGKYDGKITYTLVDSDPTSAS
ncbi:hypothetical protein EQG49_05155 [Periweissella cryptocerci]|uniref:WxL domain-containing protein n=1 Tax=Periweissella cryptocerci TaxID=2506420 RepID=A0A4P6YTB2_9LACO|nr:WxL domain-containing protein [Periweissella cryptocerci]QBO35887.1 hypothetical protein EQG49_05155 [Periweissella cryptocerci]